MKRNKTKILVLIVIAISLLTLSGCSVQIKDSETGEMVFKKIVFGEGLWDSIVYPVAWVMNFFTQWTGKFALGVIITTIIIRTIFFPVYTKTNDTTVKMQAIQPDLQRIQNKYAGKTDPESKQRMQLEMMQLYKDNDINMLAGCLMPFLQMPVFMAMYHAVARTPITFGYADQRSVLDFFWTTLDTHALGRGASFGSLMSNPVLLILPVLVVATSVLQQYISMMGMDEKAKENPTMKMMIYMMPIMMFSISLSSVQALSLYWVVGNIYSTLQFIIVKKPFKKLKDN